MERSTIRTVSLTQAQQDRACLWHPFTQMLTSEGSIVITKGEGVYLYSADGRKFIDGISSWWVNLHGHAHPYIVEKIREQAAILEHVIFADFTHGPAIDFATKLLPLLPGEMSKVFYSDNGSTAIEAALKMAFQYWYNQNSTTKRRKVICFNRGYHGDTFGAMSAAGRNEFNKPFWNHLFEVESIDVPFYGSEEKSIRQLKAILYKGESACFIFEPLILGAGGMIIYSKPGLDALMKLCEEYGVITIADEVMTGFGRTETLFASEVLNQKPDIICLSKGITGGFLPLGVTACKENIFQAFLSENIFRAFLHGHSYTANPLACVSALASLDLLLDENCSVQRKIIEKSHIEFAMSLHNHPRLKRCESIGTILVLEYHSEKKTIYSDLIRDRLRRYFLDRGVLIRPLGSILYVLPPYCIRREELQYIYDSIIESLKEV